MDLYQEIILDHSKHPEHAGLREPFDAEVHHVNPSCGDEITLRVDLDDRSATGPDAVLRDISYQAVGCSISVASASVLASELIGHTLAEGMHTYHAMRAMLTSKGQDPGEEEVLGDGVAFAGVSKYPARVKCALMPWAALTDALARAGAVLDSAPAGDEVTSPTGTMVTSPSGGPDSATARTPEDSNPRIQEGS